MRPSNGLIIINIGRIAHKMFPPFCNLLVRATLDNNLQLRRHEDPSLANGITIPVTRLGSYDGTLMDYLGPVKPGLSIQTSIS